MKLDTYIRINNIKVGAAAKQLDVKYERFRKWLKGERKPNSESMSKIHVWSDGQVTANDFYISSDDSQNHDN